MSGLDIEIRCQRCGTPMVLKDPAAGGAWTPEQFWVCPKCGRHFWTTYPSPTREKAKASAASP